MRWIRECLASLCVVAAGSAWGAESVADPVVRTKEYVVSYTIEADGTAVTQRDFSYTVLKEQALDQLRRSTITYSTSVEKAEVLAAYTLKADGRRIDAPPGNFQVEANSGKDAGKAAFSDETRMTVIFPDVAVGDTVGLSVRVRTQEPIFPGQFSTLESFSNRAAFDDVRVRVDMPTAMTMHTRAVTMQEVKREEANGRRVIEWQWRNPMPLTTERNDYSVVDIEGQPGVFLSTFTDYADIARQYGARAAPKAAVTPSIQQLADQIAPGTQAPRDTARLLYEWVATNISYAGNCIGVGAVVPRDLDFVVGNRMGDCKDHATLLQALLAAKGIASTQALVNAGNVYALAQVPVVSQVNHVINYIPSLDLFLDSTARIVPFGMLPMQVADKPALLVDGFHPGLRTPRLTPADARQQMRTTITVDEQGGISGTMHVAVQGIAAAGMGDALRNLNREERDQLVKRMLARNQIEGAGRFTFTEPKPMAATFEYDVSFDARNVLDLPGPGGMPIGPMVPTPKPVADYAASAAARSEGAAQIGCMGGYSREDYVIQLPKTIKVRNLPANVKLQSADYGYRATYQRKGQQILITREFDDRTVGNVCDAKAVMAQQGFGDKVIKDLRALIMFEPAGQVGKQ